MGRFLRVILSAALLTACTTTKEVMVPVPEIHEYVHHHTDSIHTSDTVIDVRQVIIREVDSATLAAYGIRLQSSLQRAWLIDSDRLRRELTAMYQVKTDTVAVHDTTTVIQRVEVVREVPRQLNVFQKLLQGVGIITLITAAISIFLLIKAKT